MTRNPILVIRAALFLAFALEPVYGATKDAAALPAATDRKVDFSKEIKPLLEASCVKCHAKGKAKGGFSMETREAFLEGGENGPVAQAGKSAESYLVELLAETDPQSVMPKKGTKLTPEQIGLVRAWIDQGLEWDPSTRFAKPVPENLHPQAATLPTGDESHPLDRILAAYFRAQQFTQPPLVEDRIFARRVYLDVIGLIPTGVELDEFLADQSPDKRARLAKKLLADRARYTEHWLTFWNDLLRNDYAGTGFIDGGRRQISRWLYSALYEELPFNKFVSQLVNPDVASDGFTNGIIWRGTVNASMTPPMQAAQNLSQVFMGVNLKCASCHDSFINDWSLSEAYNLAAVYSDDALELVHCDKPTGKTAAPAFLFPELGQVDPTLDKPARLKRLAEIMTAPQNGRLARTVVNRLWARLLGRGLVEPVDEMERPAWNRDLLNFLAEDLIAHDYNLKRTLELILTSTAYQLPCATTVEKETFVFRGPLARRLTAEQFCDSLSALGGTWARLPSSLEFDLSRTGPPSKSPLWIWTDEPTVLGPQRAAARKARQQIDAALNELAQARQLTEAAAASGKDLESSRAALDKAAEAVRIAQQEVQPPPNERGKIIPESDRHLVVFRKKIQLSEVPREAFATILATQRFDLFVNGMEARPVMRDGGRNGRIVMINLRDFFNVGENLISIEVSSHTEKQMNDSERDQYPGSMNHLNARSGMAFYLRLKSSEADNEYISDDSWRVRRSPGSASMSITDADHDWALAQPLPTDAQPIDEGPGLEPVTRRDYANQAVPLKDQLAPAVSIAAHGAVIRASLRATDPLQTALDRPNREQIITTRLALPTTLQALALTNGVELDARLNEVADRIFPQVVDDPSQWLNQFYRQMLSRSVTAPERAIALEMLGQPVNATGVANLLWSVVNLPEFQFIH